MKFVQIAGIIYNIDHIVTIQDTLENIGHCVIMMSNRDKFFINITKEEVLSEIQKALTIG